MNPLIPSIFAETTPSRCPLDAGTSPAAEAARWGARARDAMNAAHKARRQAACPPAPVACPPLVRDILTVASGPVADEPALPLPKAAILRAQVACAREFEVTVDEIVSSRRSKFVVEARQVAMFLARLTSPRSLPEIGLRFGHRDHTTVLYGIRKIERRVAEEPAFAARVQLIREKIEAKA